MSEKLFSVVKLIDFKDLIRQKFNIEFIKIDDFFVEDTIWHSLDDWEEQEDLEIIEYLEDLKKFEGKLLVVSDASYKKEFGVFEVDAINFKEFIEKHKENFGERFVDTDVLIVSLERRLVWIFHHEGVYAIIKFDK